MSYKSPEFCGSGESYHFPRGQLSNTHLLDRNFSLLSSPDVNLNWLQNGYGEKGRVLASTLSTGASIWRGKWEADFLSLKYSQDVDKAEKNTWRQKRKMMTTRRRWIMSEIAAYKNNNKPPPSGFILPNKQLEMNSHTQNDAHKAWHVEW